jgi:hypothetical protein
MSAFIGAAGLLVSAVPASPRLLKGGVALLDPDNGTVQQILSLQYNPDTLTRSFKIKGVGAESGDHIEALRLTGPPSETIKVEAEIDATDQLEIAHLLANNTRAASGSLEIVPAQTFLTVFIFGPRRIVPVRITEFSITEEAFDPSLNPIRAKVSLGMTVLTVDDLGFDQKGGGLFLAYLQAKEQLAAQNRGGTLDTLGIGGI